MKFRKRYILMGFILLILMLSRLPFLTFRYSPDKWETIFTENNLPPVEFESYQINNRWVNYVKTSADSSLPTILFVHGSPGSASAFIDYLQNPDLRAVANLIAVDRPGFGYSDFGNTAPSLAYQSAQFLPLMSDLSGQPLVLLGHSLGGPLIARMAIDYPEIVDGLIMVAPSIDPELETGLTWRRVLDGWGVRWLIPDALRVCNQEIIQSKSDLENMMVLWEEIKIPVCMIQGSEDKLVPAANVDFGRKMLVSSRNVQVELIEDGDHFILWSEMDLVTKYLLQLIGEIGLKPPQQKLPD